MLYTNSKNIKEKQQNNISITLGTEVLSKYILQCVLSESARLFLNDYLEVFD